jgi:sulfopyruvate decarboxylase TPP-binding subunit
MFEGSDVAALFRQIGISHVVWLPDSEMGRWEAALSSAPDLTLVRVCREGEAFGIAAGLLLSGKRPVVVIQNTGFFEAGDALRNVVHDLGLPVFVIVGYRGYYTGVTGRRDTAAQFIEPIVRAWGLPHRVLLREAPITQLGAFYTETQAQRQAAVALLAETKI